MKKIIMLFVVIITNLFLASCFEFSETDINYINITLHLDGKQEVIKIVEGDILTSDIIPLEDKASIEGIYYDDELEIRYNNYPIIGNVELYVKILKPQEVNNVTVTFVKDNETASRVYHKYNKVNITDLSYYFSDYYYTYGIYYDREYTKLYDFKPLNSDKTLYIKYIDEEELAKWDYIKMLWFDKIFGKYLVDEPIPEYVPRSYEDVSIIILFNYQGHFAFCGASESWLSAMEYYYCEDIGGRKVWFDIRWRIMLYIDGEIIDLVDAYNQNFIDSFDLNEICDIYDCIVWGDHSYEKYK